MKKITPGWVYAVFLVALLGAGGAYVWHEWSLPAVQPSLSVPAAVELGVGDLQLVKATTNGANVMFASPSAGLSIAEHTPTSVYVVGKVPGKYSVWAVSALNSQLSPFAKITVTVTGAVIPGPTPPGPTPPGPTPSPAPIPVAGFRVLIVYDSAATKTVGQQAIIYGKKVRDYLESKCVVGPDGKTREYRIWDKGIATAGESKLWQDAMARRRTSVPWVVISTGAGGTEEALPADENAMMTLLQKFGG